MKSRVCICTGKKEAIVSKIKTTGAKLTVQTLETLPVSFTFGIPGVQNTEIYDEISRSKHIRPVLVTHEGGGSFMADAVSRTSEGIGVLLIVPSAGVTHAMSGIAEAFLAGIPMLVITGGIRRDTGKSFQLHDWDQHRALAPSTKKTFLVEKTEDIVPTLYQAYKIAVSDEPGPVMVEIPADLQLFQKEIPEPDFTPPAISPKKPDPAQVETAADMIVQAEHPCIFLGWGANRARQTAIAISELLDAPVATTLQGLSVFPGDHPLHAGMGFGKHAVPASENAFKHCDLLLAVGTRFAEIPTGSFGMETPENLIHVDVNPQVFNKNYPAKLTIEGDAQEVLSAVHDALVKKGCPSRKKGTSIREQIRKNKEEYIDSWLLEKTKTVNPAVFFKHLRNSLAPDAIVAADDGNHTFLTAELFPVYRTGNFISPTDFNCMGYCIPAAIGAKLANPDKQVVGIVGDGAFLMTGLEMITATVQNAGVVYFLFHDGELSQISQAQEIPYNRKTCTILGKISAKGVADATGAAWFSVKTNEEAEEIIPMALKEADRGRPVLVDMAVDYSRRTRFTKGVVKTVLSRFPMGDKFRFIGRAVVRRFTG